jgi:tetratricopeptide (TPR) repeat protein
MQNGACEWPQNQTRPTIVRPPPPPKPDPVVQAVAVGNMAVGTAAAVADLFNGPPIKRSKYDVALGESTISVANPQLVAAKQELAQRSAAFQPDELAKKAPAPVVPSQSGTDGKLDIPPDAFGKLMRGDVKGAAQGLGPVPAAAPLTASKAVAGPSAPPAGMHAVAGQADRPKLDAESRPAKACANDGGDVGHDGVLDIVSPPGGNVHKLGDARYDNVTAEVTAALTAGNARYGIALRVQPDGSAVSVLVAKDGRVELGRLIGNTWTKLAAAHGRIQGANRIRFEALEDRYDVWIDNEHVLSWIDPRGRDGFVALQVDGGASVRFDALVVRRACDDVTREVREGDRLAAAKRWREAVPHFERALELAPASPALSLRLATALAQVDPPRALVQYQAYVAQYGFDQVDAEQLLHLAHGVRPLPAVPAQAVRDVAAARKQLQARQIDEAAASYRAALRLSPFYADAWFGLALIAESKAVTRDPSQLAAAAHAYELFALVADDRDARAGEATREVSALRRLDEGLKAPAFVQKKQRGSWPYGRSMWYCELGLGAHDVLDDGGVQLGVSERGGFRLPFLPKWSAGAFMESNHVWAYGVQGRYALWGTGSRSGTSYTELHLDLSYGTASPNWGDANGSTGVYGVGLGLTVWSAWMFGFALSTGYMHASFDRLTNDKGTAIAGRDESYFNLLTVHFFTLGL